MEPTQQQEVLGQSEQRYQELLENLSDRIAILTPEGLVLEINQRSLADARDCLEEVVGKPFSQCPVWSSSPVAQKRLSISLSVSV
jgi:transcriptional regulator with PAS, ATPase and Fis domain